MLLILYKSREQLFLSAYFRVYKAEIKKELYNKNVSCSHFHSASLTKIMWT